MPALLRRSKVINKPSLVLILENTSGPLVAPPPPRYEPLTLSFIPSSHPLGTAQRYEDKKSAQNELDQDKYIDKCTAIVAVLGEKEGEMGKLTYE